MSRLLVTLLLLFAIEWMAYAQDTTAPPELFAEAQINNPNPYVGQQITYRFVLYDAIGVSDPLYQAPDFEDFWRIDKTAIRQTVQLLNNRQYTVTELETALYPTRSGAIIIPPATLILPENVFRTEQKLLTDYVVVDVRPVPGGAPDGYSGAVGEFELSATIDRPASRIGEPLILRLVVSGTGNVEQLTLPDISSLNGWRLYTNPPKFSVKDATTIIVGEKTYEYVLVPERDGMLSLPAVTFHYFDPVNAVYRSTTTQPISLDIELSQDFAITPLSTASAQDISSLLLKPTSIHYSQDSLISMAIMWLGWLLPPIGLVACWLWTRSREQKRLRQKRPQQSLALMKLQARLRKLPRTSSTVAYRLVRGAIMAYFHDKFRLHDHDLNEYELQLSLENLALSQDLIEQVRLCLEWSDAGQYAPTKAPDVQALGRLTYEVIAAVDQNGQSG